MKRVITAQGHWRLLSGRVSPGTLRPVVNGVVMADRPLPAASQADSLIYALPALGAARFGIEMQQREGLLALRYWLENPPADLPLHHFGLALQGMENLRAFLRNGYYSWDGSSYVDLERASNSPYEGYAMVQLLPRFGAGSVVLGFDRHDRFQQRFTLSREQGLPQLLIESLWDQKSIPAGGRCASEWLLCFEHAEVENALRQWAGYVAAAAPIPPRPSEQAITGWCSWYNLYAAISEANLLAELRGAAALVAQEGLALRVFQIDDGFTPEMGDWLTLKPQFPRGMKPLLDDIRGAGFVPGLWIAPFMVGNRSQLYQQHPDWVVQDREKGGPLVEMRFYGEFRWHKRSEEYYILDATHPDAFAYLRQVFRTWRHDWGCDYFKTDFMHFGSEHGPDRARWHQPGHTRIEIWRRVALMIREEIGEALWLGCGCPLFAAVGLVDGLRIGKDVGVSWAAGSQSAQSLLRDQATRNYANRILWQADPDCILLRQHFHHLSDGEIRALALYAGMGGGVVMTSDSLQELPPERVALFRLLLEGSPARCDFPLLGQALDDPVLVQVRQGEGLAALFLLNTGEEAVQRSYPLAALNLVAPAYLAGDDGTLETAPQETLSLTLQGHEGRLYFVSPQPLQALPSRLPTQG